MKVEKYKTNVENPQQAMLLIKTLQLRISDCLLSFDQDSYHLSVTTTREVSELVCELFIKQGFVCKKVKIRS